MARKPAAALTQPQPAAATPEPRGAALLALSSPPPAAGTAAAELWAAIHLAGADPAGQLERLALCAGRYTPRVSLEPPDGVLLEVQGSLHLFSGLTGLRHALLEECRHLGIPAVLAFAPTPLAALVLARAGKPLAVADPAQLTGRLASLPLATLRWPEKTRARLAYSGVRTIGAALRLPRAGFARRFGSAQLAMLDALTGRAADLRRVHQPPVRFRRRRELTCELEDHATILAALAPLFAELGRFLTSRQCGIVGLECLLTHRHAPPTRCALRLATPAADAQHLAQLLGERLSALALSEPVRGCELRTEELLPYRPECPHLWQPGEHGGGVAGEGSGLLERLRARLGEEAVYGLKLLEGHRPEKAWSRTPAPAAGSGSSAPGTARRIATALPACAARRPLWLLPAPRSLPMRDGLPRRRGPLRLIGEPERIETGWWDGEEIARDYYAAADSHGVLLWVFRERQAPHGWYLHGVFG
ncbi:MAG TPA: DNA polymerase Y family protein [Steroidobacteraceae bacterium]|nr:DNA polymerase Y family protein [Steroidobacteraceae bacterium]